MSRSQVASTSPGPRLLPPSRYWCIVAGFAVVECVARPSGFPFTFALVFLPSAEWMYQRAADPSVQIIANDMALLAGCRPLSVKYVEGNEWSSNDNRVLVGEKLSKGTNRDDVDLLLAIATAKRASNRQRVGEWFLTGLVIGVFGLLLRHVIRQAREVQDWLPLLACLILTVISIVMLSHLHARPRVRSSAELALIAKLLQGRDIVGMHQRLSDLGVTNLPRLAELSA